MKIPAATIIILLLTLTLPGHAAFSKGIEGTLMVSGQPVGGATVTLWRTAGNASPKSLATVTSNQRGRFKIRGVRTRGDGHVLYLTAKSGADDALVLMSVLGHEPPDKVVVNELTTVASVFTSARFIDGTAIRGNLLGLRIAAGNAPNLVDPATGTWGKVLLDPINSTENTTLARLNTLASLIAAFGTVADDAWRADFLKTATPTGGTTPKNTLDAMAGIARTPWATPKELYALFDKAYPQPKDGSRRAAPLVPYLAYSPPDFAMILKFAGGGIYSPGKLQIDADGNVWSGQNWMAGSQSGVLNNIGGGTIKLLPNGTAVSPAITGFTGMGVDGIGWGTGMALDKVWLGALNNTIGVMNFDGNPVGKESDVPMAGTIGNLMGVGTAANGDVWIADATKNSLLHFPGGRVKDGRIVNVKGLKSPFGIAIDAQDRVWVSNSQGTDVVRFPADDPAKVESFPVGTAVRGVALDSKGNLWVASNMSEGVPPPDFPAGTPIMKQFQLVLEHLLPFIRKGEISASRPTGVLNMIRPDGTQPAPKGFTGDKAVFVPWGVSIDGNDDVWFGNFWGRGVGLMAGAEPKGRTEGAKTGDVIHVFQSGSIQMVTDAVVDPAGNVWVANNWNVIDALDNPDPARPTSTKGGGDGIVVIYGVASPVKTPVMGPARPAN
ncbi:NHL repeat precursor [Olavius algarvensis associated proteobacterium Delta 3]|nr:NHL repeat precursor [Olavius algarvensis associated proteobacterium Delta 3]